MLQDVFDKNKALIIKCLIVAFAFGLISHGYMFFNDFLSHDYLNEVFSNSEHKIELGRILYHLYKIIIRGMVSSPWIVGFFGLFWLAATLFFITKCFSKDKNIFFVIVVGGLIITNISTVSTIATYLHDFDANMFALLLATLAFYFWKKDDLKRYIFSVICVLFSIGIYQSYIQVTITLIIIDSIINLLCNKKFDDVLIHGLKAIISIIIAIFIYAVIVKMYISLSGMTLQDGGYNSVLAFTYLSIDTIGSLIYECYYYYIYYAFYVPWLDGTSLALVIHGLLFFICFALIIYKIIKNKINGKELALLIVLLAIMPIGSNGIYIVSNGAKHHVMEYAIYLDYLFFVLLLDINQNSKFIKSFSIMLIVIILSENIRTANATYFKKGLEYDATKSYMTNVLYDMNKTEGYIPGETKVMFIGYPDFSYRMDNMEYIYRISGNYYSFAIQKYKNYDAFFKYVLQQPLNLIIEDKQYRLAIENKPEIKEMGYYPSIDSVKLVDDILIVKFADSGY